VVHQVWPLDVVIAPRESTTLEGVCGTGARTQEQPLGTDKRTTPQLQLRIERYGLLTTVLDVNLKMVLEIFTYTREVMNRIDTNRTKSLGVTNTRELEYLR
jgi:hypothetical protein